MPMKAAIDIGSNTTLLLVAEFDSNGLHVLREEQRMPRLGASVDESGLLSDASMEKAVATLREYREIIENEYPEVTEVIVTATSAVRDAVNRDDFIHSVKEATGYSIRLLSGEEEAQWTYAGAISTLTDLQDEVSVVIDIGGGSTELASGKQGNISEFKSLDMGCVRFKERYLFHDPPFQEEILECCSMIRTMFLKHKIKLPRKFKAIGVAGTATSLAAIDKQIDTYEPGRINGHIIDREKLNKSLDIFKHHTYEQLLKLSPSVLKGREDIFLTGMLILQGFLNAYEIDEIEISTGGIRHGALLLSEMNKN